MIGVKKKTLLFLLGVVLTTSTFGQSTDWWHSPACEQIPFAYTGFTSDNVCDAINEAKQNAEGFPRAGIRATANGVVGNNDWLGPNELMPNTPLALFPVKTKLNEITWANQTANVQFHIEFRRGSKTGTIFHTLTVTSTNPGYGYVSGLAYTFDPGEVVYAQYIDDGQNMSDMDLILWISRIP